MASFHEETPTTRPELVTYEMMTLLQGNNQVASRRDMRLQIRENWSAFLILNTLGTRMVKSTRSLLILSSTQKRGSDRPSSVSLSFSSQKNCLQSLAPNQECI